MSERDYTPRRRDGKRLAVPGDIRREVLDRDGRRCRKCGFNAATASGLELHHILDVALGGTDNPDNLITLCSGCHVEWTFCAPTTVTFADWLQLPTAQVLMALIARPIANKGAEAWRRELLATFSAVRTLRQPSCPL